jgi:hypothetical protein
VRYGRLPLAMLNGSGTLVLDDAGSKEERAW